MPVNFTQEEFDEELRRILLSHAPVRMIHEICVACGATEVQTLQAIIVALEEYANHYKNEVVSLVRLANNQGV